MDQPSILRSVLTRARAEIAEERRFTAHGYAADAEGRWCPLDRSDAARFSVWGAMLRASGASKPTMNAARALLAEVAPELSRKLHEGPLTHAEALALLDAGIARLSGGDVRGEATPSPGADRALPS